MRTLQGVREAEDVDLAAKEGNKRYDDLYKVTHAEERKLTKTFRREQLSQGVLDVMFNSLGRITFEQVRYTQNENR
jgi:hypothetical protein